MNLPNEDLHSKSTKELPLELGVTRSFKRVNVETIKDCYSKTLSNKLIRSSGLLEGQRS